MYAGSDTLEDVGWAYPGAGYTPHPVALKSPNGWGIYDMSGNVEEWTWDWFSADYYSSSPSSDPEGPSIGQWRVARGGVFGGWEYYSRVAWRHFGYVEGEYQYNSQLGIRLARTTP